MEQELIEPLFNIGPDTVYGALVTLLLIFNVMQWRSNTAMSKTIIKQNEEHLKDIQEFLMKLLQK